MQHYNAVTLQQRCNATLHTRPDKVYHSLMEIIVRLGNYGLVHCDFNEFNLMISDTGQQICFACALSLSLSLSLPPSLPPSFFLCSGYLCFFPVSSLHVERSRSCPQWRTKLSYTLACHALFFFVLLSSFRDVDVLAACCV